MLPYIIYAKYPSFILTSLLSYMHLQKDTQKVIFLIFEILGSKFFICNAKLHVITDKSHYILLQLSNNRSTL